MSPELWISLFLFGLLGAVGGLAWVHGYRVRKIQSPPTQDRVFRCGKCNTVYTDDPAVDRSRCPQCGITNDPFAF